MHRTPKLRHLRIVLPITALLAGGCRDSSGSEGTAALSVRVIALVQTPVAKVKLRLVAPNGTAVSSTVALRQTKGTKNKHSILPPKEATALLRAKPGRYAVHSEALDSSGTKLTQCTTTLTGKLAEVLAIKGRLRSTKVFVECKGTQSPLPQLNQPPQDLRVHLPQRQGSFAQGDVANFCLEAWDPDQNVLRFEVQDLSRTECQIRQDDPPTSRAQAEHLGQQRCYSIHCKADFVGRMQLQARVFDQVWRQGSMMDLQNCATLAGNQRCEGPSSSKSLRFSLKFLRKVS